MALTPEYDSWRLEIPWCPPSLNRYLRQHWTERDEVLHAVGFLLKPYLRVVLEDLGVPEGPIPWKAEMTFQVFAAKLRDDDNCVTARKVILDAMKRLRFLKDDSPSYVSSRDLPCAVDAKKPRTVITVQRFQATDPTG